MTRIKEKQKEGGDLKYVGGVIIEHGDSKPHWTRLQPKHEGIEEGLGWLCGPHGWETWLTLEWNLSVSPRFSSEICDPCCKSHHLWPTQHTPRVKRVDGYSSRRWWWDLESLDDDQSGVRQKHITNLLTELGQQWNPPPKWILSASEFLPKHSPKWAIGQPAVYFYYFFLTGLKYYNWVSLGLSLHLVITS